MKRFFLTLFLVLAACSTLGTAMAQSLPTVPDTVLNGLKGYTTSYISGGIHAGKILLIGGVRNGTYQEKALLYDSATGQLETPESGSLELGTSRAYHTATSLADGRVLVFGGERSAGQYVSVAEIFDPETFSFVPVSVTGADLPHIQRKRHAASFFYKLGDPDQHVLITGGCIDACASADNVRDTIIYNVDKGNFVAGPLMQSPRRDHSATYLPAAMERGVVMLLGGNTQAEYFDIASFTGGAGTGKFVQDAVAQSLVTENQVLLQNQQPKNSSVFDRLPQVVNELIQEEVKQGTSKQNTEALQKQITELDRAQELINNIVVPSSSRRVVATDTRGRSRVSGQTQQTSTIDETAQPTTPTASQPSGAFMGESVSRALVEQQQNKVRQMLQGRSSSQVGSGVLMTTVTLDTYDEAFVQFVAKLPEDQAKVLQELSINSRDADGDGISDQVELLEGFDPFQRRTQGHMVDDIQMFLGESVKNGAVLTSQPMLQAVCERDGVLWGRAVPGKEVGVFQEGTSGNRVQVARTTADAQGRFYTTVSLPASGGSFPLVLRTQDTVSGYQYSDAFRLQFVACDASARALLERVSLQGGLRFMEGRAQPGSYVYMVAGEHWIVTIADPDGTFRAPLPAVIPAGTTKIALWSVLGGQTSSLQMYPLEIPLQPVGSGSVLGALRPAALESGDGSPFFWWIYGLGLLSGTAFLSLLAFDLRRRYAGSVTFPDNDLYE